MTEPDFGAAVAEVVRLIPPGRVMTYGDVAAANMDPLAHYHEFGWKEGRDPSASFHTNAYEAANPDVGAAQMDPMLHYLQFGAIEGRSPLG